MANWLASALPVADAVSFEFDGINATAQCDDGTESASDAPARLGSTRSRANRFRARRFRAKTYYHRRPVYRTYTKTLLLSSQASLSLSKSPPYDYQPLIHKVILITCDMQSVFYTDRMPSIGY